MVGVKPVPQRFEGWNCDSVLVSWIGNIYKFPHFSPSNSIEHKEWMNEWMVGKKSNIEEPDHLFKLFFKMRFLHFFKEKKPARDKK